MIGKEFSGECGEHLALLAGQLWTSVRHRRFWHLQSGWFGGGRRRHPSGAAVRPHGAQDAGNYDSETSAVPTASAPPHRAAPAIYRPAGQPASVGTGGQQPRWRCFCNQSACLNRSAESAFADRSRSALLPPPCSALAPWTGRQGHMAGAPRDYGRDYRR